MHNEFTAVIEKDEEWYIGYCPEIPGANGQGRTVGECKKNRNSSAGLGLIPYINWIAQAKRGQETTFDKRLWSIQGIQEHSAC